MVVMGLDAFASVNQTVNFVNQPQALACGFFM